jgi:hypothetical protein
MSRELIEGINMNEVIKNNNGRAELDVAKFTAFLESKKIPTATINEMIPKVIARIKGASPYPYSYVPQRTLDYCKGHITQELAALSSASKAFMDTTFRESDEQARSRALQAEAEAARAQSEAARKAQAEAEAARVAQADAQKRSQAAGRLGALRDFLGGQPWNKTPPTDVAKK